MKLSNVDTETEQNQEPEQLRSEVSTESEAEEATATNAEAVEADGSNTEATTTDTETPDSEAQPSKLEKAFSRVKDENKQLKQQIRELQNQIDSYRALEIERAISDVSTRFNLTPGQVAVLKRFTTVEEIQQVAEQIAPPKPLFGTIAKQDEPRQLVVDSIPTLARF